MNQCTSHFNLRKLSKSFLVYLYIYYGAGKPYRYNTGITVLDEKHWSYSEKKLKQRVTGADEFNKKLEKIRDDFKANIEGKVLTLENIKSALKIEETKEPTFFELFDEYIKDSESRVSSRGNILTPGSIVVIKGCKNTLQEFQDKTGYKLSLTSIDNNFYSKFRTYCLVDRETPYSINSFGGKIKKLKAFLTWCKTVKKLEVNSDKENFKAPSFYGQEIDSLLPAELVELWDKDLGTEQWKLDIFLFLCSTGMRYSDYKKMHTGLDKYLVNSTNGKAIVFNSTKTNCTCIVPFADDLYFRPVYLYNKHQGKLPILSEQKLNEFLRECGLITRFTLTTKIGRKTLASIKYFHLKLDAQYCMQIGGWKTEKEFRRYAGADISQVIQANKEKSAFLKVS